MSIRFLALLAISVAVAMLSIGGPNETHLYQSGRELDLSIVGHGYFVVSRFNTTETGFTRSGGMIVNEFGQLVVNDGSQEWLLDPPIHLPGDWEGIAVGRDGRVQCSVAGGWMDIGQIQLARFVRTPAFADALAVNSPTEISGPPTIGGPSDTQSIIQQGWVEMRRSSLVEMARNLLIAFLSSIVLNAFLAYSLSKSSNRQNQALDAEPPVSRLFHV